MSVFISASPLEVETLWNSLQKASFFRADTLLRDYFSCVRDNASLDRWLIALFRKEISQPSFQNKAQEYWVKQQLLIYEKLSLGICAKSAFHLMKINLVVGAHKLMLWNFFTTSMNPRKELKMFSYSFRRFFVIHRKVARLLGEHFIPPD